MTFFNSPKWLISVAVSMGLSLSANAFELASQDIVEGHHMDKTFEFDGFGCTGDNQSPMLTWSNPPAGTKSFAITAYDPDAPTGSGWWHWIVTDIAPNITSFARDIGATEKLLPAGSHAYSNDYGTRTFGGACPPEKDGMHRYQFTVWALPTESLSLPDEASAALVGYMLQANALEKATLTATYSR